MRRDELYLALPSKGEMEQPTLEFLKNCGMAVSRGSGRRYVGRVPVVPGLTVLFQRAADIPLKVLEGTADLGITGFDLVSEFRCALPDADDLVVILDDLGYSRCELVVAVPESWIDITSIHDLADLASEMRDRGRELRVATKFPRLTQRFLVDNGLTQFSLVEASGALEAAPTMGYADAIADITSSGTTLRENRLKTLVGGTILRSQACLVGNRAALRQSQRCRDIARDLLELVEATNAAAGYYSITANIQGDSAAIVAKHLMAKAETAGLLGPTISEVYAKSGDRTWYAATIVVPAAQLLPAISHLREIGGHGITVFPAKYIFDRTSHIFDRLVSDIVPSDPSGA